MLTRNVSSTDKKVRVVLAIGLILLGFVIQPSAGIAGLIIPVAVGIILLATVFLNWCPIYSLFGFSTCPADGNC